MVEDILIYQNYFKNEHIQRLDSGFTPYMNVDSENSKLYEFAPLLKIFQTKIYSKYKYTGLVSYKFNTKTNLSSNDFLSFIQNNPNYDVYFINPHQQLSHFYFNVWEQGEYWHKSLKNVANILFKDLNLFCDVNEFPRQYEETVCFANYWVGNNKFWEKYGKILESINVLIQDDKYKKLLFDDTFHSGSSAPFFPFVIERLFSSLLSFDTDLKVLNYKYDSLQLKKQFFYEEEEAFYEEIKESNINTKEALSVISKKHGDMIKHLMDVKGLPSQII